MMMQVARCESAVAQGLRSDILQATKKAEKRKRATPHNPLITYGLLVADFSPLKSSLAPECPRVSDLIGFSNTLSNQWLLIDGSF